MNNRIALFYPGNIGNICAELDTEPEEMLHILYILKASARLHVKAAGFEIDEIITL